MPLSGLRDLNANFTIWNCGDILKADYYLILEGSYTIKKRLTHFYSRPGRVWFVYPSGGREIANIFLQCNVASALSAATATLTFCGTDNLEKGMGHQQSISGRETIVLYFSSKVKQTWTQHSLRSPPRRKKRRKVNII
jgi:hypothetical protein